MLEVKNVVQKILIFLVIYFYACKITIKRVKPKTSNSGSKNVSVCKFKNESFFFPLFCHAFSRHIDHLLSRLIALYGVATIHA